MPEDQRNTWLNDGMNDPIHVIRHSISSTPRMGAGGQLYIEKQYSVKRGSSRISYAVMNGYDAIEGIIIDE